MGIHDLPAVLYHISNITEKPGEIIYIGHSMGTTMFFAFSSINPHASKMVKLMIALAPVAYMTHIKSPIKYLAPFSSDFQVSRDTRITYLVLFKHVYFKHYTIKM